MDEGVIIYESDPSESSNGLGLVWGSVLWPAGISLAKYFSFLGPNYLKSQRVLEFGSGTGVVGITMAKLGASRVTLSDCESALWPILRLSLEANELVVEDEHEKRVHIHGLDWKDPSTFLNPAEFDKIVAADVLYSGMDKLFARALASHLVKAPTDQYAIVACPFRTDSPLEGFFDASIRLGLEFERLQDKQGCAVGAAVGVEPSEAYQDSQFVSLNSNDKRKHVAIEPSFSKENLEKVQIFRVRRVRGTPEEAASIRRVSRI